MGDVVTGKKSLTVLSESAPVATWERVLMMLSLPIVAFLCLAFSVVPLHLLSEAYPPGFALLMFLTQALPCFFAAFGVLFVRRWGFWVLLYVSCILVYSMLVSEGPLMAPGILLGLALAGFLAGVSLVGLRATKKAT